VPMCGMIVVVQRDFCHFMGVAYMQAATVPLIVAASLPLPPFP